MLSGSSVILHSRTFRSALSSGVDQHLGFGVDTIHDDVNVRLVGVPVFDAEHHAFAKTVEGRAPQFVLRLHRSSPERRE